MPLSPRFASGRGTCLARYLVLPSPAFNARLSCPLSLLAPCSLLVAPSPSCDSVAPSFAVPPCLHRAANTSPPRRLLEVCPPQPPAFAFGSSSFSLPRLLLPLLLSLLHHKTRNHPWIWRHPHPGPYPALPAAAPAAPPRCHACPTTPVVPGSSVPSAHALVRLPCLAASIATSGSRTCSPSMPSYPALQRHLR